MRSAWMTLPAVLGLLLAPAPAPAEGAADTGLEALESELRAAAGAARSERWRALRGSDHPFWRTFAARGDAELVGVSADGRPIVLFEHNYDAAVSIGTQQLWPGGASGHELDGSTLPAGSLGIWDSGSVLETHQEFGGRVSFGDSFDHYSDHGTHVGGTLAAAGVQAQAHGMAPAAPLVSYDWNDDTLEAAGAAAGALRVSNHSYGYLTGWNYDSGSEEWTWWGWTNYSATEDLQFGFYSSICQIWDGIAYNAPFYTHVKSAGNDRNDAGPGSGGGHWVMDPYDDWNFIWSTDTRDPDGGASGYDTVTDWGNAKNVVTVGSVLDLLGGWTDPADVVMTSYSNWGPTDDGRIKPDLVANGNALYSSVAAGDDQYATYGGTSMAAPNLAGSLALLVEQYRAAHGGPPRSSTLKALLVHTADEAGPAAGPDYMFGWGLADLRGAADLIDLDARSVDALREDQLADGETRVYEFHSAGGQPLTVTLAWTDPPGTPPDWALDPGALMLVNDLDLRVRQDGGTWMPWTLDPADPAAPAAAGDNFRDNVEKVFVAAPAAGEVTIEVSHKGDLSSPQDYSLVFTGFDGTAAAVAHFTLEGSPGRVDLSWECGAAPEELRLQALRGGERWPVPLRELGAGHFAATDLDPRLAAGGLLSYALEQREGDGWALLRQESLILDALPRRDALHDPWPNPMGAEARLRFSLARAGTARLAVYDVTGRRVALLQEGGLPEGIHERRWSGRDAAGEPLAAGLYFVVLETPGRVLTRKLVLLR